MPAGKPTQLGRHAVVGLAVVFAASACAVFAADERATLVPSRGPDGEAALGPSAAATLQPSPSGSPGLGFSAPLASPLPGASAAATSVPSPDFESTPGTASTTTISGTDSDAEAKPKRAEQRKPKVKTIRLKPRPRPGPFSMNLYGRGDFVHQQTKDWCVAGSTQTMMNIMDSGRPNRSAAFQRRLYIKGRRLSPDKRKLGRIGVDLIGWRQLLNTAGYGPYVVDGRKTRRIAIERAAKAMRLTARPVGLVVWRGAHSWVMSGFRATADPAYTNDFRVTHVSIQDVWYPYVSTIWGASRPPNASVPVRRLGEDYLPYRRPNARWPERDGKFMTILPTLPRNTVAR